MRFQPPGPGLLPSGIGRPAELVVPLSNRRRDPSATSANAGAALESTVKPRCVVYHATAALTSLTMYRTLTVVAGMLASHGSDSEDGVDVTAGLSRRSIQVTANLRRYAGALLAELRPDLLYANFDWRECG